MRHQSKIQAALAAAAGITTAIILSFTTSSASAAVLNYDREELPGGGVILVNESHELPIVTIEVSFPAGTRYEPLDKQGLANMSAAMLLRGTRKRSASDIEKLNDQIGGGVSASAGRDFSSISLRVLTRDLAQGMELLADTLRNPSYPGKELKKLKARTLGGLQRKKDRPGYLANRAFRTRLFGDHPYGREVAGKPETIKKIRRADLVRFHRQRYGMKGAIFVFVGDISLARAQDLVMGHFGGWKSRPASSPAPATPSKAEGEQKMDVIKIDRSFRQATVLLGNRSISRRHKDFYAARVMNYILGGGGFESRITKNIREEKGLVYSAYSYFAAGMDTGHWRLMLQTKNASANQAIAESIKEIKRIQDEGVTETELNEAKAFITGNFATRFQSSSRIAGYILAVERLGFSSDYAGKYLDLIRAVKKEQIQETAKKHIRLDESVLTVVGDLKEAKLDY
ncbi:MAG: insulinase family protein [Nitrospinaceae bacterium]|jgi:zinc protease|nr:insulinase family protein [Nitrospinaceae bacterium]MBT3820882.1 insulinase family protein [Nitrospinaceae bacterium]MBT4093111.1 insulinase family protein [Nitrospinaceae bacterium]MBT4431345.1 insulinase family protein [Nitrospinaceae bacterium]MBT5367301.1 insulinase family protein [Nitrospinaceae bacterium]